MRAVVVRPGDGQLTLGQVPVPRPGPGEVLIRMAAAAINPSDLGFVGRAADAPTKQFVPGLEGSGTVVAAGSGLLPRLLVGRRVAFATPAGGTWAEYAISPAMRCVPLRRSVSFEEAAMLIVNPLTALALVDMARRGRHPAIVNNAAASALGRMIIRLGRRYGIAVVNIVRRPEQVAALRAIGADYVLDSRDARFATDLRELSRRVHATLFLDAVGGAETETLMEAAPPGSTFVAYAALSGEPSRFNARTLIADDKTIAGFYLGHAAARKGLMHTLNDIVRVQRLIGSDLRTAVQRRLPLSAAQEAVDTYRLDMSAGKVLLIADAD